MKIENQFAEIRQLIHQAKENAFTAVNKELINLYWNIGRQISYKINQLEWGKSVVKNLADYLKRAEPDLKVFLHKICGE